MNLFLSKEIVIIKKINIDDDKYYWYYFLYEKNLIYVLVKERDR